MKITDPILSFDFDSPEIEEIKRSLYMLFATPLGTMPMHRDMGLDLASILDRPVGYVRNQYAMCCIEQIDKFEPRVKATAVTFEETPAELEQGILRPHIYLVKGDLQ